MIVYKNIIIEDWALKEMSEAINKIFSTPEKKKRLQDFEMEINDYYEKGRESL